jgi:hypothetical protein
MSLASVTWLWELLPLTLRQSSSSGKPAEITGLCAQGATLRAIGSERDFRQRAKNVANHSNPTMEMA